MRMATWLALETCGAALKGAVELHVTYDEEAGGEIGPRYLLEQGLSRPNLAIGAGFSYAVVNALTAAFISRLRSSAARPTPPAPRPASTPSKLRTPSFPRFTAGGAALRRGPRR